VLMARDWSHDVSPAPWSDNLLADPRHQDIASCDPESYLFDGSFQAPRAQVPVRIHHFLCSECPQSGLRHALRHISDIAIPPSRPMELLRSSFLCGLLASFVAVTSATSVLTPPVLPLIVRNPYLSTWLPNARSPPWERWPMFWAGEEVRLKILVHHLWTVQ
jgi:hypothetical protein